MALTVDFIRIISEQVLLFVSHLRTDIHCWIPRGRHMTGTWRGYHTSFRFRTDCRLAMSPHMTGPYFGLLVFDDSFNPPSTLFDVGTHVRPCTPLAIDLHPTHPSVYPCLPKSLLERNIDLFSPRRVPGGRNSTSPW